MSFAKSSYLATSSFLATTLATSPFLATSLKVTAIFAATTGLSLAYGMSLILPN